MSKISIGRIDCAQVKSALLARILPYLAKSLITKNRDNSIDIAITIKSSADTEDINNRTIKYRKNDEAATSAKNANLSLLNLQ